MWRRGLLYAKQVDHLLYSSGNLCHGLQERNFLLTYPFIRSWVRHQTLTNEARLAPESLTFTSKQNPGKHLIGAFRALASARYARQVLAQDESFIRRCFVSVHRAQGSAGALWAWFVYKETASVVSFCFVVMSVFFMASSFNHTNSRSTTSCEHSLFSDPNFLGNLSQSILSNLSIYLIVATTIHNGSVDLRYKSWFWLCLFISLLSSVSGLSLYCALPRASIAFLWTAAFAQVVIPVLLTIKTGESEAGNEDDVELHGD